MTDQPTAPHQPTPTPLTPFEPLTLFGDLIKEGQQNTKEALGTLAVSIEAHKEATAALVTVVEENQRLVVAVAKATEAVVDLSHTRNGDGDAKTERALMKQEVDRLGKIIYGVGAVAGSAVVLAIVRLVMVAGG